MLVKKFSPTKNLLNQSGAAVVTVIVVSTALLAASYLMYNKLTTTSKLVNKIERKATAAYTVRGLLAYAKDLLSSRVCINPSEKTGLPLTSCKLTDSTSLERLLLTSSAVSDMCKKWKDNGSIPDGLQNYCPLYSGKPLLNITSFEFDILASNISLSHPLFPLFDKQYDSSLRLKNINTNQTYFASCVKFKFVSTSSSTSSSSSTIKIDVIVFKDASCTGEVVSEGGTVDIYYPRALNSYSLISNRSFSVGTTSAESDINSVDSSANIEFISPIWINKNLYIPNTGTSSTKNVNFLDKVYVGGEIKSLANTYITPVMVDTGELWMSRYPPYTGIQGGINRISQDYSLTRMFDPVLAPVNDASLMAKCNDYNRRKQEASFCNDLPKIVLKKISSSNKYLFGMTKQSELQGADVKITSTTDSGVQYPTGIPSKAQVIMSINTTNVYLSVQSTEAEVDLDLVRLNAIQLKNGADCLTLTSPDKKICINNGKVLEKTLNDNPNVTTTEIPSGTDTESASFINNDLNFERKTISNCHMTSGPNPFEVCDLKRETYTINVSVIPSPYLKILTRPKITSKGTVAPQLFELEFVIMGMNSNYEIRLSNSILNFSVKPLDYCASKQSNYSLKVDLDNSNILSDILSSTSWQTTSGSVLSLSTDETDYLVGDFCFFDICSSIPPPSSGNASYDADWSSEAFSTFNHYPVDKVAGYKPNAAKTGYAKIFDLSQTITNERRFASSDSANFNVNSIADRCVIPSTVSLVKGIYTCRFLVIENRTSNLDMVGTFIIDKLQIGSLGSGKIRWMNAYHPLARDFMTNELLPKKGVRSVANCQLNPNTPFWAFINDTTNNNRCDVAFYVGESFNVFTWTSFNPLCINDGGPVNVCKTTFRAFNFDVVQVYEYFGN
jgi:hypothetical protein